MPSRKTFQALAKQGLYRPAFEHDACGVGLVANLSGERTHQIVEQAIEVLENLEHRGAIGADPETGDGAGILVEMPDQFFREEAQQLGIALPPFGRYGVGMIFLPADPEQRRTCADIVERIVREKGLDFLGWREVPVNPDAIGVGARSVMPAIAQALVGLPADAPPPPGDDWLERRLYVVQRNVERAVGEAALPDAADFYICTFSGNSLVYKGLLISSQLERFYCDLIDPRVVTRFAIVHSRFSTNTLGAWALAHPYRRVCHNGEFNNLAWQHQLDGRPGVQL